MRSKYKFLYYKPGKLFPSEGSSGWFYEKDFSVNDLQEELLALNPVTLLETFVEMFLIDELNSYSFLSFLGDHEERGKGFLFFKKKPLHVVDMIALISGGSSMNMSLNSLLITIDQKIELSSLFAGRFNVSVLETATIYSNSISSQCTGVAIMQHLHEGTTLMLSYQR